jgi:hypothetical protein
MMDARDPGGEWGAGGSFEFLAGEGCGFIARVSLPTR